MKPIYDFDGSFLENDDKFQDEFYKRFELRHAPEPLKLNDQVTKNYKFPTFYGDVTCAIAIFMCSYEKAQKMMLHPNIKPVKMTKGRSLVAFSCYEYKNVMGVAPYNEIAMTIPIMVEPGFNPSVLPMILPIFKSFGYYVFSMPVTSLENQIRGVKIWGLPKVVQELDIREDGGDCLTTAFEESGEPYLDLTVPMDGSPADFDVTSNLYTRRGDEFLQSETNFKATFNVNKHMGMLFKKDAIPDRDYIKIYDTPSGKVLKDLEIEEHPFQFRFAKHMTSCFDIPNPDYKSKTIKFGE
jgi:Acetoacetate decarboxylase (ADC)